MLRWAGFALACISGLWLANGCATKPPSQQENLCSIFAEHPKWFKASKKSEKRWGIPIAVQMSFVKRESSFASRARPPRRKLLWVVPWRRPSSAYGYAQATNGTWDAYRRATRSRFADRNNFSDSVDFIGWYNKVSHKKLGIAKNNARDLYLAYHEGRGGYAKGSYRRKPEVQRYARHVSELAQRYQSQLNGCRKKLERKRRFLFF